MEGSRGDYSSVGEGGGCTYSWRSRAKRLFGRVASLEDFFYFFLRYGGSLLPSIVNSFDSCHRVTLCMIPYFHPESLIQCHMTKISLAKRSADQLHSTNYCKAFGSSNCLRYRCVPAVSIGRRSRPFCNYRFIQDKIIRLTSNQAIPLHLLLSQPIQ